MLLFVGCIYFSNFFWLHFVESVAFRCCFAQSNSVLAQYKSKPRLSENKTEKEEEITLHSYVWIKFIEIFSKSPFGRFIIHLLYICNSYSYEFHKTHFNCDIKVNIFRILWGFVCIQYENRQSINHNFDCFGVFLNIFSLVVGALKVFFCSSLVAKHGYKQNIEKHLNVVMAVLILHEQSILLFMLTTDFSTVSTDFNSFLLKHWPLPHSYAIRILSSIYAFLISLRNKWKIMYNSRSCNVMTIESNIANTPTA